MPVSSTFPPACSTNETNVSTSGFVETESDTNVSLLPIDESLETFSNCFFFYQHNDLATFRLNTSHFIHHVFMFFDCKPYSIKNFSLASKSCTGKLSHAALISISHPLPFQIFQRIAHL